MRNLEYRHCITVNGPVERVFPMFTPLGEMAWAPGWEPVFVYPANGSTQEGMVFRTGADAETTFWACVDWRPDEFKVRYARVTPASRFGFVKVACRPHGQDQTEACVSYTFTALTEEGEAYLADLTQHSFVEMIDDWQATINRWLDDHPGASVSF